jgi:predicted AAA+ superfamily ATPase
MINRKIDGNIRRNLGDGKIVMLYGPRQTGKSTLLKDRFNHQDVLWLDGDDYDVQAILTQKTSGYLQNLLKGKQRLIIDEAQNIPGIGHTLKQIHDRVKGIEVIVTGSSFFEISTTASEQLTGRKWEYHLFPLSVVELTDHHGGLEESRLLEQRLIYGLYPEIVTHPAEAERRLLELATSYLYKDVLKWQEIKKPAELDKLVQALAFQIGNEVSYNELAQMTGLTNETVQRYIDLLEKSFVIFTLPSFSRNLRNEIKKGRKICFYDTGIRNAVIRQFQPLSRRNDIGALWENFLIVERMKFNSWSDQFPKAYFWRTHAQQEIDYIEDTHGILHAYEFTWNEKRKKKLASGFSKTYPEHIFKVVNRENYYDFITFKGNY